MTIRIPCSRSVLAHEDGATVVEYALMVGLIAVVIVAAVTALGLALPGTFQPVTNTLP